MARAKKNPPKQPLVIRTHALTTDRDQFLKDLSHDASDALGWTVSSSAIVRALIQHAAQQSPSWITTALFPLIEHEIASGRVWGSRKK